MLFILLVVILFGLALWAAYGLWTRTDSAPTWARILSSIVAGLLALAAGVVALGLLLLGLCLADSGHRGGL